MSIGPLDLSTIVAVQSRSKVYVMTDPTLGRVCIKEGPSELLALARHEFRVLQILNGIVGIPTPFAILENNANVAVNRVSEGEATTSNNYLVTTFLKGAPLHKLFYQFPQFPVSMAATVFSRVAAIMKQVHGRGVVHGDIKLPNILLLASANPAVALVDFGSSTIVIDSHSSIGPPAEACSTMHTRAFLF